MVKHELISRELSSNVHPDRDSADIVIVGNGIAGLTAALEARRLAPEKRIAIITEQSHPTINTPALKQFAVGKLTQEQLLAYPAGTERTRNIEIINARVEEIYSRGNMSHCMMVNRSVINRFCWLPAVNQMVCPRTCLGTTLTVFSPFIA